jgi:hypothetical protein
MVVGRGATTRVLEGEASVLPLRRFPPSATEPVSYQKVPSGTEKRPVPPSGGPRHPDKRARCCDAAMGEER